MRALDGALGLGAAVLVDRGAVATAGAAVGAEDVGVAELDEGRLPEACVESAGIPEVAIASYEGGSRCAHATRTHAGPSKVKHGISLFFMRPLRSARVLQVRQNERVGVDSTRRS